MVSHVPGGRVGGDPCLGNQQGTLHDEKATLQHVCDDDGLEREEENMKSALQTCYILDHRTVRY